ncbi:uncharacterized protein Z519_03225 [Cladophialophora bantiana CBS 173.52]|uniref:Maintenance of telomere capping protein 6 n=1 Tax=Cladophialophora bantiana (strain ATCC 10958 / CBS 173.52 / CDC B-1940 / NIH 8579) TaxID=1442370 RepID=A0A0D2HRP2_CLAB1|nr:uncharacterized protein Z519_03225 [Cladophialophora bantiana CBS 173.52]KIW96158.1 hypothetical protein Z519_03225 [Cladophialophora bantiana CBS 173.52]
MTTLQYQPDPAAEPDDHWGTVFLSMRDASGQIPINYITYPGVYVTEACFANGVYDDLPTQTCISDLFASQFRRLIIDLYWDNINRQFSLCPVELPPLVGNATAGYSVDTSALYSITASTSLTTPLPTTTAGSNATVSLAPALEKRQSSSPLVGNSTSLIATTTPAISRSATISTSDVAIPTSTGVTGGTLLQLGPYMCSLDLNIGAVISLYNDYFDQTSDTISARLHFLDIKLHAAAPFTNPSSPAQTPMPGRLPRSDELIGAQFEAALSRNIYTPQNLQDDRKDLNRSWFRDDYKVPTDANYFRTVEAEKDGIVSTPDGWPGQNWILLTDSRRLLLSWDEIDPQMAEYDFVSESSNVFNASELLPTPPVEWSNSGEVTSGCYYHSGETTVAQTNASWAVAAIQDTSSNALPILAEDLTACGFSSITKMTLGNSSVQNNLISYQSFAQSTVFGWAPGEPRNTTSANGKNTNDDLRCAVIDATSRYRGHWRLEPCQKSRRAACRIAGQPYAWRLSTFDVPYSAAPDACPEDTSFDLPRTGLENTYLHRQILNDTNPRDDGSDGILSGVWINFNSLDQANCWVLGGPNATCPYSDFKQEEQQRQILIPTVAALIILLLSVLTILVKCNQNRRNSRTRRRGDNGWEYEGIPS